MASSKWKTWLELAQRCEGKKLVFWGASNWIERTLNDFDHDVAYIVDKSPLNQGTEYCGFPVHSPEKLRQEAAGQIYIVISTANYMSVIDDLEAMGFVMGDQFCCSPVLNQRERKDQILSHSQTVLVTSQQHWSDERAGGGVYKYTTQPASSEKVYAGKCRGIARSGEHFYVVDMLKGVVVLDPDFEQVDLVELPANSEPHGLFIDEESDRLYVGLPGRDSVARYSLSGGQLVDEYFVSRKWHTNKKDNHHVNDPWVHGQSLYVSLFSFSGNWLNEIYDGGILEISLETGAVVGPVVSNLWMPHSVTRVGGKLAYLDSMRGSLYWGSENRIGQFSGFVRGLAHDGQYFYVGTSEHRYPEKLRGLSRNISLDTGFFLFDPETRMSKFFALEQAETMHSLLLG